MTERFKKTRAKLVKTFLAKDLLNGSCTSCAIGTLCNGQMEWSDLFCGGRIRVDIDSDNIVTFLVPKEIDDNDDYLVSVKNHLETETGYSLKECAEIERVFEEDTGYYRKWQDSDDLDELYCREKDMFIRLSRVINTLMKFDKIPPDGYMKKLRKQIVF